MESRAETESEGSVVHVRIVSKTKEFQNESTRLSSSDVHHKTVYSRGGQLELLKLDYYLEVFPNGSSVENSGYVSIAINNMGNQKPFEGTCIISVVDASRNQRFTETFAISGLPNRKPGVCEPVICVDKYLSRAKLLSDPADLLPDDTLTLNIEVYTASSCKNAFQSYIDRNQKVRECFEVTHATDGNQVYLLLDTSLAKCLAVESKYFDKLSQTPMLENFTRRTKIGMDEYPGFLTIGDYLFGAERLTFSSIIEIFNMFVVADKYDIAVVTEVCLCFLKLCLADHDARQIRHLGEDVVNAELWEKLDGAMMHCWSAGGDGQAKELTQEVVRDCVWTYKHDRTDPLANLSFEILSKTTKVEDETSFDFYK